jgi:L-amino acid N-acyltransferase YncA
LSPWKSRCAYSHSVEGSVYVHHECHRQGIGKILLTDLIERARALGYRTLIGALVLNMPPVWHYKNASVLKRSVSSKK